MAWSVSDAGAGSEASTCSKYSGNPVPPVKAAMSGASSLGLREGSSDAHTLERVADTPTKSRASCVGETPKDHHEV